MAVEPRVYDLYDPDLPHECHTVRDVFLGKIPDTRLGEGYEKAKAIAAELRKKAAKKRLKRTELL